MKFEENQNNKKPKKQESVESSTNDLILSQETLESVCQLLNTEFQNGLKKETNNIASVKMYPTYVKNKPKDRVKYGHFAEPEEGTFLALDLGGTNFRVILVELIDEQFHMDSEKYTLTKELMLGPGDCLFDYIADCLHKFVLKRQLEKRRLPLGFTFSFPCQQESLTHARLVKWTKGFKCSGVEGRDVVELLREAIDRRPDLSIEVMAVVNDTTGTLMSCAYQHKECRVGLIVGTGTNACYMEQIHHVDLMKREADEIDNDDDSLSTSSHGQMLNNHHNDDRLKTTIVNTEWGAFGDNGALDFIRTKWDEIIDSNSINVGKQKFEKMISGLYIGELCRLIFCDMVDRKLLFESVLFDETKSSLAQADIRVKLSKPFSFESRFVSEVESDGLNESIKTRAVLREAFNINEPSEYDCENVKTICARLSTRSAHLVSAAVATLLNRMKRKHTVVGVDGSMFRFHPHFCSLMNKKTRELTNDKYNFELIFSDDGSGKGAAIVASVACKQRRISKELLMA